MEYGIIFFVGLIVFGAAIALDEDIWAKRIQVGLGVIGAGTALFGLVMSVTALFA